MAVMGDKDIMAWWHTQEVNVRGVVNYLQYVLFRSKDVYAD